MTEKTHNQKLRDLITEALQGEFIEINSKLFPLLGNDTTQLVFECRDGKVSAVKPEFKIIK